MTNKSVKILAPATIANIVCGFDVLGMALSSPADEMQVTLTDNATIQITHTDNYGLPTIAEQNVAGVALLALLKVYPKPVGFIVVINKVIKPGSGLGSSAASAAGAVVAANYLLNNYFTNAQLIEFAMFGEELASKVKHADNIAPCIYGGVTLVRSTKPLDIIELPTPSLIATILHPQIEIKTADARQMLPTEVSLKKATQQWANIAGLVAGFYKNDADVIGRCLQDVIIEPIRSKLIPIFDEVKKQCLLAGAIGGGISGSGPSIFMLSKTTETAMAVKDVMSKLYSQTGIPFHTHVSSISHTGVKILYN